MKSQILPKPLAVVAIVLFIISPESYLVADSASSPLQTPLLRSAQPDFPANNNQRVTDTHDSVALILLSLIVVPMSAKVGGAVLERFHQPAVLGELISGIVLGNAYLLGWHGLDYLKANATLAVLAEIGVILLLFEVGLESNLKQMLEVGISSFLVASVGVIFPLIFGWAAGALFLSTAPRLVHVFIGATLCATSIGITARVLRDLGKTSMKESRIILGAAVIDDVMGLVILAAVIGMIKSANSVDPGVSTAAIGWVIVKAVAFVVIAIWTGSKLSPLVFSLAAKLQVRGMLLATSMCFCFLLSYVADRMELAPIVGAFAAGLILDPVHYLDLRRREGTTIEVLLQPISSFLVPIFFVMIGVRVDLKSFADPSVLRFALVLTIVAILGKQLCSLAVIERHLDRLSIGVGMIPRGEVGLIFASLGASLTFGGQPVVSNSTYSAIVIMVILTTLITPPLLKISLARGERIQSMRPKADTLND